jgi:flagellar hook-basal body complex protein FliE
MNAIFSTVLGMIPGLGGSTSSAFSGSTSAGLTTATPAGSSFASALSGAINQVETSQQSAKTAAMQLLTGGKGDVSSVALASQRAELSLELFQQVRNKFVSAYQEIMKMPM